MPRTQSPAATLPSPPHRQRFRRRLLRWYDRHGRDLPWRRTRDPYHILVSEMMLQQTQVDRVLPKYSEWLSRFPTMESLAASTVSEATRAWYPLGYNIRPVRLHTIAREVVSRYDGKLPSDADSLRAFKGLGEYTVGAVRSFAFGQRAPIVDTNVARLLSRVFLGNGKRERQPTKRHLWTLSQALLPYRRVFDFNQALMDFGATICLPRNPRCDGCVMRSDCQWLKPTSPAPRGGSRRPDK